jgi:putative spermidine/putrescine transport system ATP-binding protein
VFQSYALFPHLSARDNVAFGLKLRQVAPAEMDQRVASAIASVGLQGFEDRLPANLSGGQQQRVAVARAIVIRPRLLLLDEPLSNLDARLRVEMRAELRRIQRELGITMLYVTHDQEEALSLSDRIVVMRDGRIEQDGPPEAVYHRPATPFVAGFMGWQNLLAWRDGASGGRRRGGHVPLALPRAATHVAWRPEHVAVVAAARARWTAAWWRAATWASASSSWSAPRWARSRAVPTWPHPGRKARPWRVRLDPARAALI